MEPDGYVYYEMRKGMYRLKQAARLAFDNIVKLLAPHGYFRVQEYPGVWKHKTLTTVFTLCVDNFGTKANYMEEMHHLINAIKKYFKCSINWGLSGRLCWNLCNTVGMYPGMDISTNFFV